MARSKKTLKRYCIGIVTKGRPDLTEKTLLSLYFSDQPKSDYDIIIIDNKSSDDDVRELKNFVNSKMLPIKNAYFLGEEVPISVAWNLFLFCAQDYEYRTKIDNDMVMLKTIAFSSAKKTSINTPSPAEADPLAGAPRSASIVGGVNSPSSPIRSHNASYMNKTKKINDISSRFLNHLTGFMTELNVDVAAFVPVAPRQTFISIYESCIKRRIQNKPYLSGGVMQISKKAFDTIGYFDERLSRRIDIEYSQRAIQNGLNIGYHPLYWAVHMGNNNNTDTKDVYDRNFAIATQITERDPIKKYSSSKWDKLYKKLTKASLKNLIINVY